MFTTRTLLFLTVLAALFVATYSNSVGVSSVCIIHTDCDSCTSDQTDSCGWCESTSECLVGNAVGPGGSALNCSEWFFDTCMQLDCNRYTSCSNCLRDPFCVWCPNDDKCLEGTGSGPMSESSCDGSIISDRSDCPASSTTSSSSSSSSSTSGRRTTSSSTTGRRTTTTGRKSTSSATGSSSTTGRRSTTSGHSTTNSGSSTNSGSTTHASSTTHSSSSTQSSSSSTTSTSTSSSSTTGPVNSSSAAFTVNSASVLVALGVVLIALVNLLW